MANIDSFKLPQIKKEGEGVVQSYQTYIQSLHKSNNVANDQDIRSEYQKHVHQSFTHVAMCSKTTTCQNISSAKTIFETKQIQQSQHGYRTFIIA